MADWIKFEATTPDKPEVVRMASDLGIDQDAVVGKLLRLWVWADQNSVNGNGVSVTSSFLDRITFCPGFASAMRGVGWLVGDDGALSLPNFDRHNGKTAKGRAVTNRRVAEHRSNNAESNANVTPLPLQKPLPDKIREDKKKEQKITPVGDLLADISPQVATDFRALRNKLRAPITETAMAGIRREAGKAGMTLEAALSMCCERGWRGFKAEWVNPTGRNGAEQPSLPRLQA